MIVAILLRARTNEQASERRISTWGSARRERDISMVARIGSSMLARGWRSRSSVVVPVVRGRVRGRVGSGRAGGRAGARTSAARCSMVKPPLWMMEHIEEDDTIDCTAERSPSIAHLGVSPAAMGGDSHAAALGGAEADARLESERESPRDEEPPLPTRRRRLLGRRRRAAAQTRAPISQALSDQRLLEHWLLQARRVLEEARVAAPARERERASSRRERASVCSGGGAVAALPLRERKKRRRRRRCRKSPPLSEFRCPPSLLLLLSEGSS